MAESNREEIAKLEAIYANNPGGRVFTHLAEAYRKAGELDRARSILNAGIARHPDYASAHVVLGRVLLDQGKQDEAAVSFNRVLELDPENRVALRTLGDLALANRPDEALSHYLQLQSLDPSDEELAELVTTLKARTEASAEPAAAATAQGGEEPGASAAVVPQAAAVDQEPPAVEAAPAAQSVQPAPAAPASAGSAAGDSGLVPEEVGPDYTLDWTAAEPDQPVMPGDLEELARETVSASAGAGSEKAAQAAETETPLPSAETPSAPAGPSFEAATPTTAEATTPSPAPEQERGPAAGQEILTTKPGDQQGQGSAENQPSVSAPVEPAIQLEASEGGTASGPTFEDQLSRPLSPARGPAGSGIPESEMPTETLAELYRTQGFYERATEVYQTLLQQRPGDERLRERLAEVEELQRSGTLEPVSDLSFSLEADSEPTQVSLAQPETWVEDVESVWTGGAGAAALSDSPYAWELESEESASGPTLQMYLTGLLGWRPSVVAVPDLEDTAAPPALPEWAIEDGDETSESSTVTAEPDLVLEEEAAAWLLQPEPWELPVLEDEVEALGEATASDLETVPFTPEADDLPQPPVSEAPDASGAQVADAFEEWFSEEEPSAAEVFSADVPDAPTADVPDVAAATVEAELVERAGADAGLDTTMSDDDASDDDSDDDLEMFRSWLQSLKR